jgi:hypothetical protein
MLLRQPAILAVDAAWKRFVRTVGKIGTSAHDPETGAWSAVDWQNDLERVGMSSDEHSPALPPPVVLDDPDTPERRRARAAILRAQMLSRQGRFIEAESAFSEAVALDPHLDLARVPSFWELERGGQESAVRALQGAGRSRDAMVLRARLENRYKPRLVRSA